MIYRGKEICGIRVYNSTDNTEVASICEDKIETTNGYEVEIKPSIKEKNGDVD